MSVEIYVLKNQVQNGQQRFDLQGKNLPENLLGMAADLQFSGDLKNWQFDHWEWGDVLTGKGINPILLVKPDWPNGKLILGLTQKADQLKAVADGRLMSMYFKGKGQLDFQGFSRQILSIYDGKRVDLPGIVWKDSQMLPASKNSLLVQTANQMPEQRQFVDDTLSAEVYGQKTGLPNAENTMMQADLLQNKGEQLMDRQNWWWMGLVLGTIVLVLAVLFRLKRRA
jgi:hypothetical protein